MGQKLFKLIALVLAAAAFCLPVQASVTYSYQGNALDVSSNGTIQSPISMSFTFDSLLGTSWNNISGVGLLSWTASQATAGTLTNITAQAEAGTAYAPMISFHTTNGSIDAWYVSLFSSYAGTNVWNQSVLSINNLTYTTASGSTFGGNFQSDGIGKQDLASLTAIAANNNANPGVWSMAVSPAPEPESYAMMLVGLGLVGAAVKRRKAKQA